MMRSEWPCLVVGRVWGLGVMAAGVKVVMVAGGKGVLFGYEAYEVPGRE